MNNVGSQSFSQKSWVGWFREHSAFNHMTGKIFSLSLKPNPPQAVADCSFPYLIFLFQGYHIPNVLKCIDLKVVKAHFVVPVIHVRKIFSQKKQVHENIFTRINCWFHISLRRGGGKKKTKNLWIISDVLKLPAEHHWNLLGAKLFSWTVFKLKTND